MSQGPAPKKQASSTNDDAEPSSAAHVPGSRDASAGNYTVVARRYRPQRFEDVVGQDHVVQALRNAIRLNRLAQAYLFCGTRGVGKTSMARIFAKCLNCVNGPTEEPCQVCDICQAISVGQDVDVIEIDGASNNGVEQVRELRQNVSLRPSRAKYKIYYIDEVHMLSTGAFNALLKTLEEPPPHVKFFFATTEANKIPITVLSRCQRYDFAGITPEAIVGALKDICDREQVDAEVEALQVVARRAGGSMRDAQSLLEQLLSSGSPKLTVEVVHGLLGTASDERLLGMLEALSSRDPAAALTLLDQAASQGVQASELLAGTLDFLRDAMVLSIGAGSILLTVSPRQRPRLQAVVDAWSTDSIVTALQILAEARARMRGVAHGRLLAELALVRVARLEDLEDLTEMVQRLKALESGSPLPPRSSAPSLKKKLTPTDDAPNRAPEAEKTAVVGAAVAPAPRSEPERAAERPRAGSGTATKAQGVKEVATVARKPAKVAEAEDEAGGAPLELHVVSGIWPDLIKKVGANLGWKLSQAMPIGLDGPDVLVIGAKPGYNSVADLCGTDEARRLIADSLRGLLRRPLTVRYQQSNADADSGSGAPAAESRRADQLQSDPMVQKVIELFEARVLHLEYEGEQDNDGPSAAQGAG
ncbi:DNA polymerase III subunit gamma/tau [Paludisphaera borealis]|uniref:DNA polymerase III subunit gamma/tau n=1 Tax=Paludisphaera borealis TaxID=1387353 RepID=A0A1U7CQM3_9BACT|nr:DNA polymerase III subunit gamma/tau [Paludisphaera borealis]APW61173.1 DNA polymerase III subunit tau [Paludisphaera borealis]